VTWVSVSFQKELPSVTKTIVDSSTNQRFLTILLWSVSLFPYNVEKRTAVLYREYKWVQFDLFERGGPNSPGFTQSVKREQHILSINGYGRTFWFKRKLRRPSTHWKPSFSTSRLMLKNWPFGPIMYPVQGKKSN
jgi:hypothetical protein